MVRRRRANDGPAILFLLVALVLAYVAPFVMIGLWAWYEYQARRGVDSGVEAGFEHSEERRILREEVARSSASIDAFHEEGSELGLVRRQDGMFDGRYADGRNLNALISEEVEANIIAQQRLAAVVEPLARRDALRFALLAYLGLLFWFWARSSEMTGLGSSGWSSAAALVVGTAAYFVRKTHYVTN